MFVCDTCGKGFPFDGMAYVGLVGDAFKDWRQECRECSDRRIMAMTEECSDGEGDSGD